MKYSNILLKIDRAVCIITLIVIAFLLGTLSSTAQTNTRNEIIVYDGGDYWGGDFTPKAGSQFGLSVSWDRTGMMMGNFDVYPNNKVFMGVTYGYKDLTSYLTEYDISGWDLLVSEVVVSGRIGLRVLPWTYVVGTIGNHRIEIPWADYSNERVRAAVETIPYKDELFYGAGAQVRIPYAIFNNFKIVAGVMYTNRNSYDFDGANFRVGPVEHISDITAAGERILDHIVNSDLTFTVGVTIPLTEYRSQGHARRKGNRRSFRNSRKRNRINKRK